MVDSEDGVENLIVGHLVRLGRHLTPDLDGVWISTDPGSRVEVKLGIRDFILKIMRPLCAHVFFFAH